MAHVFDDKTQDMVVGSDLISLLAVTKRVSFQNGSTTTKYCGSAACFDNGFLLLSSNNGSDRIKQR
jgi:hypothetical protein